MESIRVCMDCGLKAYSEEDLKLFAKNKLSKYGRENLCKKCDSVRQMKRIYGDNWIKGIIGEHRWTNEEEKELIELFESGVEYSIINNILSRHSMYSIYIRISKFRKIGLDLPYRLSTGRPYKDLGIRPPCPECGSNHPNSNGTYWHCKVCGKFFLKT